MAYRLFLAWHTADPVLLSRRRKALKIVDFSCYDTSWKERYGGWSLVPRQANTQLPCDSSPAEQHGERANGPLEAAMKETLP
jgi:hypothetical protein